ncbi:threonine synthase [Marinicrinis lubricantis]|uniref:Threonine synthase n=1 Tax=Marinicrinis lubricantis TaxID=2086470 RepID=A0ABW1IK52_9BACL
MERFRFICSRCGKSEPFSYKAVCDCGGTLLVDYDLELVSQTLFQNQLSLRSSTMWRYRELLPIQHQSSIVSLGEGWTPLLRMPTLEKELQLPALWIKREEQNPTGSFKARGFAAAVSIMNDFQLKKAAVPSNGNAASALSAYAARAGIEVVVIVPKDCPGIIVEECVRYGAKTFLTSGLIHDAGAILEQGKQRYGWVNVGTLKEPGRIEGKKTMGLELAEQLGWKLPDVIVYPTGGGSGIIGMWKAFNELIALGWICGPMPRIVSVQESGCDPIVQSIHQNDSRFIPAANTSSSPTGMRVPHPPDGDLLLSILRQTNGTAVTVTAQEIAVSQKRLGRCGISSSPEGAAALAGCIRLRDNGWIRDTDRVVVFNTSHADKYIHWAAPPEVPIVQDYHDFIAAYDG